MFGCQWSRVRAAALFALSLSFSIPALAVNVPGTSVRLSWTAASGPVSGYAVQVSRGGSAFKVEANVAAAAVSVAGSVGETLVVRIAAFDVNGRSGPFSPLSDSITFVPGQTPAPGDPRTDLDGNGLADSLAVNPATGVLAASLLASNGTRQWVSIGTPANPAMRPVGYGDIDGDGRADVLWRNPATGANEIWRMRGLTYSVIALPTMATRFAVMALRDFTGDGKADALFHDELAGESWVWELGGSGLVRRLAVERAPTGTKLAAVGDVDGDRAADLVWQNATTRAVDAWLLSGIVPRAVVSLGYAAPGGRVEGVGDLDHDGKDDLVWLRAAGLVDVWFLAGASAPKVGLALILATGDILRGVVDWNSDGKDEVVIGRPGNLRAVGVSPVRPAGLPTRWTVSTTALTGIPFSGWQFLALE